MQSVAPDNIVALGKRIAPENSSALDTEISLGTKIALGKKNVPDK